MTAAVIKRPRLCGCAVSVWCIPDGMKPACLLGCAIWSIYPATGAGGRAHEGSGSTKNACMRQTRLHIAHIPHTPHAPSIKHLYRSHTAHPYPTYRTKAKMIEKDAKAVIRCTPDNAAEMRALVKRWPQLNTLVTSLQTQGVFPGLRGLQITLTGSEEFVGKGLVGVMPENAAKPVLGEGA